MAAMCSVGRFSGSGVMRLSLHVERTGLHFTPKRCKASRLTSHLKRFKHTVFCPLPLSIKNSRMPILNEHFSMQICSRSFNSGSNTQRKVLSSAAALNLPSIKQIEQFLNSKGMPYEHGHTSIVVGCLHCEKEKGKTAEKSMFVNKTTGSHFCRSCGSSGSWRQFKAMHSDQNSSKPTSTSTQPEYNEPVTMSSSDSDEKAKDLWNISLPLKDATDTVRNRILESFKIEKLTEEMLTKYQVHVAEYKFSEPTGKSCDHQCVVFPWYNPSKSTVHGVKLVRIEQDAKELVTLQPRLGTLGLFGWNTITPEAKEVVLALNEFDAIAVHQATSCPAISLPLGTHSLPPEVLPQLEQFERIILWFGEDVRARQAANQFSKKLSIQRCHIVRPPGDSPPSGPLDALNKGFDLNELVTSSKPISHEKIATFQELRADVYSELVNADQVSGVKWSRFPKLNSLLKGHRRGELTIFTGPTGAGKTTLLSEMSVDLCQQGVNTLWGSFEIRNVRLAKIMMSQFSGVDLSKNVQQFNYWADKFEMLPMYFMCFYGSQNISTVIETMAHAVYVFDIDHVVIDNLQFMTSSLRAEDRFSVQNQAISSLRDFASSKNVHVTLVIHPRKENDDVELQTASIFGTAKASQEADNVLILQDKKGRGEKYLQITKNRFDGSVGRVPLEFVKGSLSMCGFGKKDTTTTNNNNKMQNTFKPSKKISDIDMINIPSGLPIQKARLKPYSPVFLKSDSANPEAVQGQRSKHSPTVFQKSDKATPEEANVHKSKISPPGFSKSEKGNQGGARLSFSSKDVESVRTFQENLSESIRSRGLGQKSPASSPSKVVGDAQKLDAKKLYSKTVASLVAKHVIKNRIQQKKVTSLGRLKPAIKTNK